MEKKELASEYIKKLTDAKKKFENEKYKKENVLKNLSENQSRLAKWEQVESGNKSHLINDDELYSYIKSRFEDGTLKSVIDLAIPLIKEHLCKTIDKQLKFLES